MGVGFALLLAEAVGVVADESGEGKGLGGAAEAGGSAGDRWSRCGSVIDPWGRRSDGDTGLVGVALGVGLAVTVAVAVGT